MSTRRPASAMDIVPDATPRHFHQTVVAAAVGTAVIAAASMLAYTPGLSRLGSWRGAYYPMAPSTALCLLVLAGALARQRREPRQWWESRLFPAMVLAVSAFGVLVVAQHFTIIGRALERRTFGDLGQFNGLPIGRMSPVTAGVVALTGLTLLGLTSVFGRRHTRRYAEHGASIVGTAIVLVGGAVLHSYLSGPPAPYFGTVIPPAPASALALMLLGIGLIAAAGPASIMARGFVGESTSARLTRAFLPVSAAVVIVQHLVTQWTSAWLAGRETLVTALLVTLAGAATVAAVARVSHTIGRRLDDVAQNLRHSDARLHTVLEVAGISFWTVDARGQLLDVDESYSRMSGYTVPELLAMRVADLEADDTPDEVASRLRRAHTDGGQHFESRHRRKNGTVYDVAVDVTAHPAGGGLSIALVRDITERKLAEARVRASEESFRTTLHSIGDGVIAADAAGTITHMNAAAERMTGWKFAEALERPWASVFQALDSRTRRAAPNPVARVLEGQVKMSLPDHLMLRSRNGQEFQITGSAAPIRGPSGRVQGVVLVFHDITEEARTQQALASTARLLERTGALAKVGGWVLNLRTDTLTWTRETCRIHEVDPSTTPSVEQAIAFYSPESRPVIQAAVKAAIDELRSFDLQLPLITATGRHIWVRAQGTPVVDGGEVVQVFGAIQDITEQKDAEARLRQSEARLEAAQEVARVGSWETNLANLSVVWSAQTYRIFGVEPEEFAASHDAFLSFVHRDDRAMVDDAFRRSFTASDVNAIEHRIVTSTGAIKHVEERWRIVRDDQARPIRAVGTCQDITQRKELSEQLRQAQKLEAIGRLAGGVAHDFNNMLAAILGYAELAMRKLDADQEVHDYVTEIRAAANRSATLTRQLLAFARKQTMAVTVLDLNESVGGVLKMIGRLIGEDVALEWHPGGGLWPVKADPAQIDQIMTNLAVNARDAMTGSDGRLVIATENVTLDAAALRSHPGMLPGDYVRLSVRDNGSGMAAEVLAHIFDPFFTTKPVGLGTGLGLSTVHGIVEQHGGFIDVESTPGIGTSFLIHFRRTAAEIEAVTAPKDAIPRGTETILLVEDEPSVLALVVQSLQSLGYSVLSAHGGPEALALATTHAGSIHLLLTDVIMPGMDGVHLRDALQRIRPDLRVLFMSGYTGDMLSTHRALQPGVQLLHKPFSMQTLAKAVRDALA